MFKKIAAGTIAVMVAFPSSAQAFQIFSDRASWESAVNNESVLKFSNAGKFSTGTNFNGTTVKYNEFNGTKGFRGIAGNTSLSFDKLNNAQAPLGLNLGIQKTNAIGFDISSLGPNGNFSINIPALSTFSNQITGTNSNTKFFGVVGSSSELFDSLNITCGSFSSCSGMQRVLLDNIAVNSVAQPKSLRSMALTKVPEPSVLLGLFAAIGLLVTRNKSKK